MATVRTVNFKSAVIAGTRVEVRNGRLMVRTSDVGIYAWDATGAVPGVNLDLHKLGMVEAVAVQFDDGPYAGQASVSVEVETSQGSSSNVPPPHGLGRLGGLAGQVSRG